MTELVDIAAIPGYTTVHHVPLYSAMHSYQLYIDSCYTPLYTDIDAYAIAAAIISYDLVVAVEHIGLYVHPIDIEEPWTLELISGGYVTVPSVNRVDGGVVGRADYCNVIDCGYI